MRKEDKIMFNEKITYFRKKNMLTQEDLANRIGVSRQTITKWESGLITPNLEYLMDLSDIFGVTIDTLIKDDDCMTYENKTISYDGFIQFLIKAKTSSYANKEHKSFQLRTDSHDYIYEENEYKYCDSFFGRSFFSGQEVVYIKDNVCWSMNYYGNVLSEQFKGDFLKDALIHVTNKNPFRGPELYKKGEYIYISHSLGTISSFEGHEEIYYKNQKIYEGKYHGGIIK